jgi:hypothetical protein
MTVPFYSPIEGCNACFHATEEKPTVIYYVYFDRYRQPRRAISEKELAERYESDAGLFLRAMEPPNVDAGEKQPLGHVGILHFESQKELEDFLEATGEEIIGFYECHSESRPYNF